MSAECPPMLALPVEVLEHIFSFLRLNDRKAASLVCHLWNELAFSRRFMGNVRLRLFDYSRQGSYLRKSSRQYRNLITEELTESITCFWELYVERLESFESGQYLYEDQLWDLLKRAPKLRQLSAESVVKTKTLNPEWSNLCFPAMNHLQEMRILSEFVPVTVVAMLHSLAPQLKSLCLAREVCTHIIDLQFPLVEVLELVGLYYKKQSIAKFLCGFKSLKEIYMKCSVLNSELDAITNTYPNITKLCLTTTNLNPNAFCFLERLKSLKTLSVLGKVDSRFILPCKPLKSVKQFTIEELSPGHLACDMKSLKQLLPNVIDLKITRLQNDACVLSSLRQNFSHLKRLSLNDNTHHDPESDLLENFKSLEELTLGKRTPSTYLISNKCLTRLKLVQFWLTKRMLRDILEVYPNLKYLELIDCMYDMQDIDYRWIPKFPSALTEKIQIVVTTEDPSINY
ncbi:uncharacterized protein LOC134213585 [Armigeres subalbatus]|uniref:uncharacterized protein LOC134213585 n=1 Tax=Armigeres subalbatus TaxID=124917 RepID=UPI002ED2A0A9